MMTTPYLFGLLSLNGHGRLGSKMDRALCLGLLVFYLSGCAGSTQGPRAENEPNPAAPFIEVLGITQDAGYPQAGCKKACCEAAWKDNNLRKMVSCIAVIDPEENKGWMIDATPDFKDQLAKLESTLLGKTIMLEGIFLTHAHIGHYTGLVHLGREVMGARNLPLFAMPRMRDFLKNNGPWSQLVKLGNIEIRNLTQDSSIIINQKLKINPILVPHRDEFSETVAYLIEGPSKKLLYMPDIDKWHLWEKDILELINAVDYALLDGTFYKNGEIPERDMSEIPHPFIEESLNHFSSLSVENKMKVYFTHFNHTNPLLLKNSGARNAVMDSGFRLAEEGMRFFL